MKAPARGAERREKHPPYVDPEAFHVFFAAHAWQAMVLLDVLSDLLFGQAAMVWPQAVISPADLQDLFEDLHDLARIHRCSCIMHGSGDLRHDLLFQSLQCFVSLFFCQRMERPAAVRATGGWGWKRAWNLVIWMTGRPWKVDEQSSAGAGSEFGFIAPILDCTRRPSLECIDSVRFDVIAIFLPLSALSLGLRNFTGGFPVDAYDQKLEAMRVTACRRIKQMNVSQANSRLVGSEVFFGIRRFDRRRSRLLMEHHGTAKQVRIPVRTKHVSLSSDPASTCGRINISQYTAQHQNHDALGDPYWFAVVNFKVAFAAFSDEGKSRNSFGGGGGGGAAGQLQTALAKSSGLDIGARGS
eukprot:3404999-Rhodomonas_salina.3